MTFQVQCSNPQCRLGWTIPAELVGRALRCPRCGSPLAPPLVQPSGPVAPAPLPSRREPVFPHETTIGRYQIRGPLGVGSYGQVYRAFDPHLLREVAIKVLHPDRLDSTEAVERFRREARSAGRLHHPGIVPVYDAGQHEDRFYIASALIDGQPLSQLIPPGGMDPRRAVQLTLQVAEALAHAHEHGILHRDVKPANVLVDRQDQAYLTDFGLAGSAIPDPNRLTRPGSILGTPAYMSPEQARSQLELIGPATDLYSLGVILYQMLTGHVPFEGSLAAVIQQVIMTVPLPPSQRRPDVDPQLDAICMRLLAKNPAERFPSARVLADTLRYWLNPTETRPKRRSSHSTPGIPAVQPAPPGAAPAAPGHPNGAAVPPRQPSLPPNAPLAVLPPLGGPSCSPAPPLLEPGPASVKGVPRFLLWIYGGILLLALILLACWGLTR